ncbi:MAG: hypothetical protein ACLS4Z_06590 [Christensenellaceae bacterium]
MEINKQDKNSREKRPTSANDAAGASGTETKKRFVKNRTGMRSAGSGTGTSMQATALLKEGKSNRLPQSAGRRRILRNIGPMPSGKRDAVPPPHAQVQPRATEAGALRQRKIRP